MTPARESHINKEATLCWPQLPPCHCTDNPTAFPDIETYHIAMKLIKSIAFAAMTLATFVISVHATEAAKRGSGDNTGACDFLDDPSIALVSTPGHLLTHLPCPLLHHRHSSQSIWLPLGWRNETRLVYASTTISAVVQPPRGFPSTRHSQAVSLSKS